MTSSSLFPAFATSPDDGIPLSACYWFETHEAELKAVYLARMKERSQQPSADSYVGWCFKRYDRYLEACGEQFQHIGKA